jgi:hypothetical protein
MNAAMHGISRREALDRMDDIIQFAELEDFVDSPLRQYSSGMYCGWRSPSPSICSRTSCWRMRFSRLATSASRSARLLRGGGSGRDPRPVRLHDMAAVSRLCHRIIWIDKGEVMRDGEPESVVPTEDASLRGQGREAAFGNRAAHQRRGGSPPFACSTLGGDQAAPTTEDVYVRLSKVRSGAVLRGLDVYAKRFLVFRTTQAQDVVADRRGVVDLLVRIPAHLLQLRRRIRNVTVYTILGKETKIVMITPHVHGVWARCGTQQARRRRRLRMDCPGHVNAKKRKSVV